MAKGKFLVVLSYTKDMSEMIDNILNMETVAVPDGVHRAQKSNRLLQKLGEMMEIPPKLPQIPH